MRGRANQTTEYIEGFLAGQTVAYCEAIKFGSRIAGQIACQKQYARNLTRLISEEKCRFVIHPVSADRLAIWIYRDKAVWRLIKSLQSAQTPELAMWSAGKLFGYGDREVLKFIARSM